MRSSTETFIQSHHKLLIGGCEVDGHSGARIAVVDPSSEQEIASVPAGDTIDVDHAVEAANSAMRQASRAGWSPAERSRLIGALADAIEAHAEELAQIESLDVGKPIRNARAIDIPGAVSALRYFAGWATKISGETMSLSLPGNWQAFTVREPIGVVGQIIPWNYPLMGAVTKLAPAIAAGCAVVLKPAEQTPLAALRLGQIATDVGFPPGFLNVVTGFGPVAGASLVQHPHVAKISFTGSTATGEQIVRGAAATMKRVTVELGGKSPVIVMPDADLDRAAAVIARSIFVNSGQTCSAGSRLLVHDSIAGRVVARIVEIARHMKVGVGMDDTTDVGPLISATHRDRVMGFIDQARCEGASIAAGGVRPSRTGYFVEPTVITQTRRGMSVVEDEVFGPVLAVEVFHSLDLDEIATEANSTSYGLAAYIWTSALATAHGLIHRLKAGTVRVNAGGGGDFSMPVGGFKRSGVGRENGKIGVEAYTELKSVTIAY